MSSALTDKFLRELAENERFAGFVVLRSIHVRQKKDGSPFLTLEFGDRSGRMPGKLWDHVEEYRKILEPGKIVKLLGSVTTYQDQKEIQIERLRLTTPEDPVDRSRLIAVSERPVEEMRRHLRRLIEAVVQPGLRSFLRRFFDDPAIAGPWLEAPAGKLWHHCYLGGLAEHSLNMAEILLKVAELYPHADKDLLIAGALLHDVGKIEELSWDTDIDYTDRGRLVGHIVLGQEILLRHRQDGEMPEETWNCLLHLLLAHQGNGEQGSPVKPQTLEAILLYYADEMDSKANAFNRIIQRAREQGDRWSEYIKLMERFLYAGSKPQEGGEVKEGDLF